MTLVAAWGPSSASAQGPPGFYVERFEPMPTQGINLLNLAGSSVLGNMLPSAGFMFQYIDDPLQLVSGDDQTVLSRVIERQIKADLWLSFGIANFIDLGVVLPLVINQSGGDDEVFERSLGDFALGDIRLVPKIRLINPRDAGGFGLAILGIISLPTGDQTNFASDGKVRGEPRLALDWTDSDSGFSIVANIGYHIRPKRTVHNLVIDDALTWGLGVRVPTPLEELKFIASVFGTIPFDENIEPGTDITTSDLRTTPIELDLGAELALGDFTASLGGGFGLTEGFGSPDFRLFLSFGYVPRCVDSDGDGICDKDDKCPDEPEDFDGFEDEDGCPDPDNDGDGICDPWVAEKGLSAKYAKVCKGVDQCPNDPEDFDGFEDEDGCPDPDNDGDGICDPWVAEKGLSAKYASVCRGSDQCPDDPEDIDGFEDEDGCPDPDNDGDGEPDVTDGPAIDPRYPGFGVCRDAPGPNEAELIAKGFSPPWIWQDAKKPYPGCPMVIADCVCGQIVITQMVQFRYNSAALDPSSFPLLDAVAAVLLDKACASKVRVEGHTDWHGPAGYNDQLSQRRAETVVTYLVNKGVERARLQAKGYGERKPVDPNDHTKVCTRCTPGCVCEPGSRAEPNPNEEEIRRLNRRVQFRIMELTDDNTGAVDECPIDY